MQTMQLRISLLFVASLLQPLGAQNFDNGSDGSYGPIVVDSTTGDVALQVPEDGIFNCTTISVTGGASLSFLRNANNTPVYLLATGDVVIGDGGGFGITAGSISVSGKDAQGTSPGMGGPGGFNGGYGGALPSSGFGPGGGVSGSYTIGADIVTMGGGSYGTAGTAGDGVNRLYGSPLVIPLIGGSGGGGGNFPDAPEAANFHYGGGGGGGAILISSNTKISFSSIGSNLISANGGSTFYGYGGGSGGAIRLVAPVVSGHAGLSVVGNSGGGFGRTRIDCLNHSLTIANVDSRVVFGNNMVIFPPNLPSLRILEIAGQTIDNAQNGSATYTLPPGTPNLQSIEVEVENFGTNVPLVAVISPEVGDKIRTEFTVDNTAGGKATGSVQVQIPAGQLCQIDVWTR